MGAHTPPADSERLDAGALAAHAAFVRRLAGALLRDEHAAADLAQDALVAAARSAPPRGPFGAWLRGVVRNTWRMRLRAESRRALHERGAAPPQAGSDPADDAARRELVVRVARAVDALEEPYRTTVFLRWYEDLPPRAIAARQGVPVDTVNTRLRRAHAQLRALLDAGTHGGRRRWTLLLAPLAGGAERAPRRRAPVSTALRISVLATSALTLVVVALGVTLSEPGATQPSAAGASGSATAADAAPESRRRTARAHDGELADDAESSLPGDLPTLRVHGVVLAAESLAPLPGVSVDASYLGVTRTARTDAAGAYAVDLPRVELVDPEALETFGSTVHLLAQPPGRVPASTRVERPADADLTAPVLLAEQATAYVAGRVRDAAGDAVAGARVALRLPSLSHRFGRTVTLTTDADGAFGPVPTTPGVAYVSVKARGHGEWEDRLVVPPSQGPDPTRCDVALPPARSVPGCVRDAAGAPLGGVRVFVRGDADRAVRSGSDGRFLLPISTESPETVVAEADGWIDREEHCGVTFDSELAITLERPARVRGRVLRGDGAPAGAGLRVWAQPEGGIDRPVWAWTSADGTFELPPAVGVPHELWVHDWPFPRVAERHEFVPGATYDIELRMSADAPRLRGRVVDDVDGSPLASARIGRGPWWPAESWHVDSDGRFDEVVAGSGRRGRLSLSLAVRADGHLPRTQHVEFDLAQPPHELEIRLARAVELELDVTDVAGRPVAGACVTVGGDASHVRCTDAHGRATVCVAPASPTRIDVRHPVLGAWNGLVTPDGRPLRVELAPAEIVVRDGAGEPVEGAYALVEGLTYRGGADGVVRVPVAGNRRIGAPGFADVWTGDTAVTLHRSATFRGVVVGDDGRPRAGLRVEVTDGGVGSARTAADGTFEVPSLHADELVRYVVRDAGFDLATGWATCAAEPLRITAPRLGSLRVVGVPGGSETALRGMPSAPRALWGHADERETGAGLPTGAAARVPWPAGSWFVEIVRQDRDDVVGCAVVDVRAGEETVIDVAALRPGGVSGIVTGADGEPVAGALLVDAASGRELARTGADGRLVVGEGVGLPAARRTLRIEAHRCASRLLDVDLAAAPSLAVVLQPAPLLTLTLGGVLPAGAQVLLVSPHGQRLGPVQPEAGALRELVAATSGVWRAELLAPGRAPLVRTFAVAPGSDGRVEVSFD